MTPMKGILVNPGSPFLILTLSQLRNHFRSNGPTGPNRFIPEDDFRPFQPIRQQRMPNKCTCAPCEGELGYL